MTDTLTNQDKIFQSFISSIIYNDKEKVKGFLESGVDPYKPHGIYQNSPLHIALSHNCEKSLEALLEFPDYDLSLALSKKTLASIHP